MTDNIENDLEDQNIETPNTDADDFENTEEATDPMLVELREAEKEIAEAEGAKEEATSEEKPDPDSDPEKQESKTEEETEDETPPETY